MQEDKEMRKAARAVLAAVLPRRDVGPGEAETIPAQGEARRPAPTVVNPGKFANDCGDDNQDMKDFINSLLFGW